MWTEAQRMETEAIARELDDLKRRAEGSELRSIAFLIDIVLSEARDELAQWNWPPQRTAVGLPAIRPRPQPIGSAKLCRHTASSGRVAHDRYPESIIVFRQPRGRA